MTKRGRVAKVEYTIFEEKEKKYRRERGFFSPLLRIVRESMKKNKW